MSNYMLKMGGTTMGPEVYVTCIFSTFKSEEQMVQKNRISPI